MESPPPERRMQRERAPDRRPLFICYTGCRYLRTDALASAARPMTRPAPATASARAGHHDRAPMPLASPPVPVFGARIVPSGADDTGPPPPDGAPGAPGPAAAA